MIWTENSGDRGECYLPRPISPRRDLHNSSYHMKTESNNADVFQIWSTLAGYEEITMGFEAIRNEEIILNLK